MNSGIPTGDLIVGKNDSVAMPQLEEELFIAVRRQSVTVFFVVLLVVCSFVLALPVWK